MAQSAMPQIQRLRAANAAAVMERVAEAGLIERGCVAVISVDAIRERTADRWPRKRDDVWAYVNKKSHELLAVADIHHRISETDFLVAMTSESAAAVQAVALRILEEVLVHFLGAAETPDLKIRTVTEFGADGEISCAALDPSKISRAATRRDTAEQAYRKGVDPVEEKKRNPITFVTSAGHALRIDFAIEAVTSLRHEVTAALRISPTVVETKSGHTIPSRVFGRLSDDDLERIDHATLEYGSLFLANTGVSTQPALILPSSFRTMGSRKGRQALATASGGAMAVLKSSVMIELVDVDRGTPVGRLTEVTGLVTSICRGVVVRLRPAKDFIAPVYGFRAQGLTVDAADLGGTDTQIAANLLAFGEQARGVAPALMAFGLANDGFFQVAAVAGLTHASVRAIPMTAQTKAA